jgi:hypothetical protein
MPDSGGLGDTAALVSRHGKAARAYANDASEDIEANGAPKGEASDKAGDRSRHADKDPAKQKT